MNALPSEFETRLREQFPEQANTILSALQEEPISSVQLNPSKPQLPGKIQMTTPWCPHGKILAERPVYTLDPCFHAGCYYPQESSSMFLWYVLDALDLPGHPRCLDLCAAPGGKSILLTSYFSGKGFVVSNEIHPTRNSILQENLTKTGRSNFIVTRNEPAHIGRLENYFDLVLVDAPCSGEGMFRKDPASRDEWSKENVMQCGARQKNILSSVIPSMKAGAYLVYSTCTFSDEENKDTCVWLSEEHGLEKISLNVPSEWNIHEVHDPKYFGYHFFPGFTPGEGFFVAVFRKADPGTHDTSRKARNNYFEKASRRQREQLEKWISPGFHEQLMVRPNGTIHLVDLEADELSQLAQALYISQLGLELGQLTAREFIPSHGLAMSGCPSGEIPVVELSREQALSYLRREDPGIRTPLGWVLFSYMGHSLGMAKVLPSRVNNYYPKEWRIRMS